MSRGSADSRVDMSCIRVAIAAVYTMPRACALLLDERRLMFRHDAHVCALCAMVLLTFKMPAFCLPPLASLPLDACSMSRHAAIGVTVFARRFSADAYADIFSYVAAIYADERQRATFVAIWRAAQRGVMQC